MSLVDPEHMSASDLVCQLTFELRGRGTLPSYREMEVISEWVSQTADLEKLLQVLADELPDYFARQRHKNPSIVGARRLILSRLKDVSAAD